MKKSKFFIIIFALAISLHAYVTSTFAPDTPMYNINNKTSTSYTVGSVPSGGGNTTDINTSALGLGGQNWYTFDMSTRRVNNYYTNTSVKTIEVCAVSDSPIDAYVNYKVVATCVPPRANTSCTVTFTVPPGIDYSVNTMYGYSSWVELR